MDNGRVNVRAAASNEYTTVRSICNAAMLELEDGLLRQSSVLVAESEGRILGALVLCGPEIEAVAVRPGRRGQGIGRALVEEAAQRRPFIKASFDPGVWAFYTSLGFEGQCSEERCQGYLYTI